LVSSTRFGGFPVKSFSDEKLDQADLEKQVNGFPFHDCFNLEDERIWLFQILITLPDDLLRSQLNTYLVSVFCINFMTLLILSPVAETAVTGKVSRIRLENRLMLESWQSTQL
jgi:hypothetical protein